MSGCAFCKPIWFEKLPETTIDSGASGTVSNTSANFGFSSDQSDATFQCKLDDGAFERCTSPKTVPSEGVLSEGAHTVQVRAVDSAGGVDPTPASRTWKVDTIKPTVISTTPLNRATNAARGTNLTAPFSEKMKASSINGKTFKLFTLNPDGTQTQINDVVVSLSSDGLKAKLNPFGANWTLLARITKYKGVLTTGTTGESARYLRQRLGDG